MAAAGIHFGNTNCVISIHKDDKMLTVSNETGDRVTPTIVAYTGSEKMVGQPAKQYLIRNPLSCITHIKAVIGQSFTDDHVKEIIEDGTSCKMTNDNGTISYTVKVEDDFVKVSAIKAASFIFTKLLEIAEHAGGNDLEDVVIAVPLDFSEEQRISLCEAAENIGFNVLRVISEPAAAMLAYGIGQEDNNLVNNVLVFRLGGSSMDATLVNVNSGMYRVANQKVLHHFGGRNFDQPLVKCFADEFKRKYREDISSNKRAMGKLSSAVENCKIGLTKMQSTTCSVDSLHDGFDFQSKIARAKFESLCNSLYPRCTALIDELLQDCKLKENQIDKVILVGGGTHMPRVVKLLKDRFSSSEILNHISPDEVLAQGAAIQASLLQGREDIASSMKNPLLDCTRMNIGIKVLDESNNEKLETIVSKCTPVPVRRCKDFSCPPTQTSICLSVYQFDTESLQQASLVAKIALKDLGDQEKLLNLTIEITRTGRTSITLFEKNSQRSEQLSVDVKNT